MNVTKFEIVDHGLEHPDYFQGCGTAFTEFTEVYTGHGQTPYDAAQEALDLVCHDNNVSDELLNEMEQSCSELENEDALEEQGRLIPEDSEAVYMVSIRIK